MPSFVSSGTSALFMDEHDATEFTAGGRNEYDMLVSKLN
jgi:hypothetical protein